MSELIIFGLIVMGFMMSGSSASKPHSTQNEPSVPVQVTANSIQPLPPISAPELTYGAGVGLIGLLLFANRKMRR